MNKQLQTDAEHECKVKDNDGLREILANPNYWQPEFVEAARAELQNRKDQTAAAPTEPLFLYIPIVRLIVLSILSLGMYQAYWIYRNWRYVKDREHDKISPFWRGIFGVLFCHRLLRIIHQDADARAVQVATFSPSILASVWVVLVILGNVIGRLPVIAGEFGISLKVLDFVVIPCIDLAAALCLAPVQNYVNAVTQKRNASEPYYRWSIGHIVCVLFGAFNWWALYVFSL